jgi:hypothetical protein
MKITKTKLRKLIKEELERVLEWTERFPEELGSTTLKTSDGKQHTLVITGLQTGYRDDTAQGSFNYTIDGKDFDLEFHSGYDEYGGAANILLNLNDEDNDALFEQIADWLEELRLEPDMI